MINQAALKFFRVNFKFLVIINLLILSLFACDGNNDDETQIINNTEELGYYSIQSPDQIFQVDDYINAGWKKSKSFITDALDKEGNMVTPNAVEIWYGFFNKKDIEIRFYTDHQDALGPGVMSAEKAVGRAVNANSKGGIITSTNNRVSYQSYVVTGNTVILCQDLLNNCLMLANNLK